LRIAAEGQAAAAEQPSSLVLQLDEDGLTLHAGDLTVTLTENEALLLSLLLQHRGEPVSKETLHRALCRGEDTPSGSNKVEVHLCNLRRKLEQPLGLRLISTVRGQGYRLLP
jgi:DNA-binding response OmpR family regulator